MRVAVVQAACENGGEAMAVKERWAGGRVRSEAGGREF